MSLTEPVSKSTAFEAGYFAGGVNRAGSGSVMVVAPLTVAFTLVSSVATKRS
jgi:hypothetical protein